MLKKYFWHFIFLLTSAPEVNICLAQVSDYNPPSTEAIYCQPFLNNPAYYQKDKAILYTNFHTYTGSFCDVNYTNIGGVYKLKKNNNSR